MCQKKTKGLHIENFISNHRTLLVRWSLYKY